MAKAMRRLGVHSLSVGDLSIVLGPSPTATDLRTVQALDDAGPAPTPEKIAALEEEEAKRAERDALELELASSGVPLTEELAAALLPRPR